MTILLTGTEVLEVSSQFVCKAYPNNCQLNLFSHCCQTQMAAYHSLMSIMNFSTTKLVRIEIAVFLLFNIQLSFITEKSDILDSVEYSCKILKIDFFLSTTIPYKSLTHH